MIISQVSYRTNGPLVCLMSVGEALIDKARPRYYEDFLKHTRAAFTIPD